MRMNIRARVLWVTMAMMVLTPGLAGAAEPAETAEPAPEGLEPITFAFDSPIIKPYWNRQAAKVELDAAGAATAEQFRAAFEQQYPDKPKLQFRAALQSPDGAYTYFEFTSNTATDFIIVGVQQASDGQLLGWFSGSRA